MINWMHNRTEDNELNDNAVQIFVVIVRLFSDLFIFYMFMKKLINVMEYAKFIEKGTKIVINLHLFSLHYLSVPLLTQSYRTAFNKPNSEKKVV